MSEPLPKSHTHVFDVALARVDGMVKNGMGKDLLDLGQVFERLGIVGLDHRLPFLTRDPPNIGSMLVTVNELRDLLAWYDHTFVAPLAPELDRLVGGYPKDLPEWLVALDHVREVFAARVSMAIVGLFLAKEELGNLPFSVRGRGGLTVRTILPEDCLPDFKGTPGWTTNMTAGWTWRYWTVSKTQRYRITVPLAFSELGDASLLESRWVGEDANQDLDTHALSSSMPYGPKAAKVYPIFQEFIIRAQRYATLDVRFNRSGPVDFRLLGLVFLAGSDRHTEGQRSG